MSSCFGKKTRLKVFNMMGGRCFYCGCKLSTEPFVKNEFVIDHIHPKIKGGNAGKDCKNLVAACRRCNSSKKDLSLDGYRRYVSMMRKFTETGVRFSLVQVEYLESQGFSFGFEPVVFFGEK